MEEKYEKSISACSRRAHDRFHVRLQLGKEGSHRETIKIGLAFPMSGTAAMAGKYCTHGPTF